MSSIAGAERARGHHYQLIVISAPSGSGKTTIARELMRRHPDLLFSVSATTRPRRSFETEGTDYFFLTKERFQEYIRENRLVEWEEIYGEYYGTLKSEVDKALREGKAMLFDIDVKGALSIKKHYPQESLLIFIKPPSIEELTERLTKRKTEDPETINRRLERVPMEMDLVKEFDMCIVNDDLEKAVNSIDKIVSGTTPAKA